MMRKRLRAVIFGPQGSGKGTQGELLSERFDVPIIGAGDLCREEIDEGSQLGNLVKEYVSLGMLAPDELVNAIVQKRMKDLPLDKGFILDGYPRNVEQAALLDRIGKVNLAIQIKVSDRESVRRLLGRQQCPACRAIFHLEEAPPSVPGICSLCGHALITREDDKEEVIRNRLAVYHFMTEPLAGYYRQRGVLLAVNGEQPIHELFAELVRKIIKLGFVG
jgi:adenylate kinase